MDDPIADIEGVIRGLTQGDSNAQQQTLEKYFTHNASFKHPFCAVHNNRKAILRIFQWYKILSPHIQLEIESVAYDEQNFLLYVTIHQVFAIWFLPFHRSPVTLTTVLQLARGQNLHIATPKPTPSPPRYYIASQNDLYQVDQFVRFFAPWGLGTSVIALWHWIATLFCILGAWLLQPLQGLFVELSRPITGTPSPSVSPNGREVMRRHARDLEDVLQKMSDGKKLPGKKDDLERGIDEQLKRQYDKLKP